MANKILIANQGGYEACLFYCPGCKCTHIIPVEGSKAWGWNKSVTAPSFTPSIKCWSDEAVDLCHSYVTDGRIQFLEDSKHALKGQTVDLPDWV